MYSWGDMNDKPKTVEPIDEPTFDVTVYGVPLSVVNYLRVHAKRAGHADRMGATLRWAILDLEKRLRAEEQAAQ